MNIDVNGKTVKNLTEIELKILKNDINEDVFEKDIEYRVKWVIEQKCEQCIKRLREEWIQKLKERGIKSVPTDNLEFAELVFSQYDYKDRSARDSLEKQNLEE